MKKIGYIRVSTHEQRPDRQISGLKGLCDELHVERISATNRKRPVFERVTRRLKAGDRLLLWDLDRAFRSTRDALDQIENLRARGVELEIANLHLDTATPAGIFVYTIMSALAEFERRTLIQRTKEGLAEARRRGRRLGRPPKIDDDCLGVIRRKLQQSDVTITALAAEFGVAPWTISRALKRQKSTTLEGVIDHENI